MNLRSFITQDDAMPLPAFNGHGDLPPGRHTAGFDEVVARFGSGTPQRRTVMALLRRICELAQGTNHLDRLAIFGSYVSDKPDPNDVDVILVMQNDFVIERCPNEAQILFDHARADTELWASVFWVRPDMLFGEPLEDFLASWEKKRDGGRRGIVEVWL